MSLATYNKKRNFSETSEPRGIGKKKSSFRFVVQKHNASHLHYDFRLELGGVLVSWAVPKGPSMNPSDKRLAVHVEDHPVSYINFHGTIPKGNYGAGTVEIWDKGTFIPVDEKHQPITEKNARANIHKGELKFILKGKKLKGEFALVTLKNDEKNWLLIKHKDEYAGKTIADDDVPAIASIRHGQGKKFDTFIKPMMAETTNVAFNDKEWLFEIKWDGYRAIAEIHDKEKKLYSRNGLDFSQRFPAVYKSLDKIKHTCIIDGEIVLLNEKDTPDFQKLQHYESNLQYPLVYYVFDLLELNGTSTTSLPLIGRKKLLKKLLPKNQTIRFCDHIEEKGIEFLANAKKLGLEGIIAKLKNSTYKAGVRNHEWLKIKNIKTTEAVIAGYTAPRGGRNFFGSLILATKNGKHWEFRGHVGTGFNNEMLGELKKLMKKYETNEPPFTDKKIPVNEKPTWLKPELVIDIGYTEITKDHIFRHPVFLRLRDEKKASNLNDESLKMSTLKEQNKIKAGKFIVPVSNLQKVYWPDEGYTKEDLILYYRKMAPYILPYLKNRPLSLNRMPNGIAGGSFYQKDAGENAPSFVEVFPVESGEGKMIDYIVCNNEATLIYAANLGCIEMNPWNSTTQQPDKPTWMVIDIDPSPQNTFIQVVDAALATKMLLDKAGIKSYCKTSGATGIHVYVPLKNKYDYEPAKNFGNIIASMVHEQLPGTTTMERTLSKRGPYIYMDYLQNRRGQTLASVYSVRPRAGATVSAPLLWKEVNHQLSPGLFTIMNIADRVKKKGDLFNPVLTESNDILKALKKLDK